MPFPALTSAVAIAVMGGIILTISWYFDKYTHGFLTISIMVVLAFICAAFASMMYDVPQNPVTEILIGALATALGAIVSQWVGRGRLGPIPPEDHDEDKNEK